MTEPVFLQISFVDKGVSKVLFSCHPDDFSLYFNDLVNDISSTKKCEIYYLEDQSFMPDNLDEYYAYIKDISLFVFPITKKFINEFCRAKDVDFMYALSSKAAILRFLWNQISMNCLMRNVLQFRSSIKQVEIRHKILIK